MRLNHLMKYSVKLKAYVRGSKLDQIQNILSLKIQSNTNASLYLIEPSKEQETQTLNHWVYELLAQSHQTTIEKIKESVDLLIPSPEKEKKSLSIDQIQQIIKFCQIDPNQLTHKYLLISDISVLSEIHFNKLLKTFEEPEINLIVFLLNPHKKEVLATIKSRAITYRVLFNKSNESTKIREIAKETHGFAQFSEKLSKEKLEISEVCAELLEISSKSNTAHNNFIQVQKLIGDLQEDYIYHNSFSARAVKIYKILELNNLLK